MVLSTQPSTADEGATIAPNGHVKAASRSLATPSSGAPRTALLPLCLGASSGVLLWISFYAPPLAWIALVPFSLLVGLEGRRRWIYLGGWLCGLTHFLPGVEWIRHADDMAWIAALTLGVYLSLFAPAALLFARVLHRWWRAPLLFALPIAWIAAEYLRMHLLTGFGWLMLAHSLYRTPWLLQVADLGGVYAVSFVVAMMSAAIGEILTLPLFRTTAGEFRFNPSLGWRLTVASAVLAATGAYGTYRTREARFTPGPRLALVQTNLPQRLKMSDSAATLKHVLAATRPASSMDVDLVIWPETSYPYYFGEIAPGLEPLDLDRLRIERRAHLFSTPPPSPTEEMGKKIQQAITVASQEVREITNQLDRPLLIGTVRNVFRDGVSRAYNGAVLYIPTQGPVAHYDKYHLVPFGEYLPLEDSLPFLRALTPYDANYDFGLDRSLEFRPIHYEGLNFATLICFEDTLPHIARIFVARATPERPIDFFVNQSNDGWYIGSVEADYHLAASVFRCVENRRPMARVCNIGRTCVIDGNGRLVSELTGENGEKKRIAGVLEARMPLDGRASLYTRVGDVFALTCLTMVGTGLAASAVRQVIRLGRR